MVFLILYFALFAVFLFLVLRKQRVFAMVVGGLIAMMFYSLLGVGIAQASTMSLCTAEGVIHGRQAEMSCRANLRNYQARQVIHQCRTTVINAEHRVYGQTKFRPVVIPESCVGLPLYRGQYSPASHFN